MPNWKRVNRNDLCKICGHDSWCVYNTEACICMRVESNRPKTFKTGEIGYIHRIPGGSPITKMQTQRKATPAPLWDQMMAEWPHRHGEIADELRLPASALMAMRVRWCQRYKAWAFPMTDGTGHTIGLRLRSKTGDKFSYPGSHNGLFNPIQHWSYDSIMWIVEGATDTVAAVSLGLFTIGRPSCSGGMEPLRTLLSNGPGLVWRVYGCVIVSDKDGPGLAGAQMLQRHLTVPSTILLLPAKDLREFVVNGGTVDMLEDDLKNCVWTNNR